MLALHQSKQPLPKNGEAGGRKTHLKARTVFPHPWKQRLGVLIQLQCTGQQTWQSL